MLDLIDRIDFFCLGVADPYSLIEFLIYTDVDVLIYGGADHRPPIFPIEGRQVTAPSGEAHPKGSLTNNHFLMVVPVMKAAASARSAAMKSGKSPYRPSLPP